MSLTLQFDANQPHQRDAIQSVVDLFEGFTPRPAATLLQAEVVPNLTAFESLKEDWLADNLRRVQKRNEITAPAAAGLDVDEGLVLEGVGNDSVRYPHFTIEMETGTGKTYVYLRLIHELRRRYGFGKFVIVVPSVAIYEGVIKNFQITRAHFRSLYDNETVHLIPYDGARLSQLRAFAGSAFVEILLMTLDAFNKASNVIYKPSEKLPGEHLPIWYVQQTRPILILDEPQNMESETARAALRTLKPLFALRFSATHRTSPNLVYRLTPFDAYRLNLVKKIQVLGVTERENFNQPFLHLTAIETGRRTAARLRAYVEEGGRLSEAEIRLAHGDDLFRRTQREEHRAGFRVSEINAAAGFVEFENGLRLTVGQQLGPRREDLFRVQIHETIKQHMEMQARLRDKDIKVLSLFFIDRVANYTAPDGIIRRLFDEEFEKLKSNDPFYKHLRAEDVRSAYFAKKRDKSGQEAAIDTAGRNQAEREAEKAAFALIMKDKERLLSFAEPVCFIFAHSALKEGWDNPNVFQICTLNQTVSELKKRQEIGRGLRLAVNQRGERVHDEGVNILTVIANESYERYAAALQREYVEDGLAAPPPPSRAGKATARRNDGVYAGRAFRDFWAKLQKRVTYQISLDTDALIQRCVERINKHPLPAATLVVEKGDFVITDYTLSLQAVSRQTCKLALRKQDTRGDEEEHTFTLRQGDDLERRTNDPRLRGYRIVEIIEADDTSRVVFSNGQTLYLGQALRFQSESPQPPQARATLPPTQKYSLNFDLLGRAARETGLTRATLRRIFQDLNDHQREALFNNPEGFASLFIGEIRNALADHVAERIRFTVQPVTPDEWGYDLDDLFPPEKTFPQKELIAGSPVSLYDQVQIDSDVEKGFVQKLLNPDGEVIFYFKFPPAFRFEFPTVIGNYNPDWGIARYVPDKHGGKVILELVRETKGQTDPSRLQFAHEGRKITCARKLFEALGVDYRVVTDQTADWWRPAAP